MIEIKGTNINKIECYLLTIRKKSFLFFSKPNLSNLRHFVNVTKDPQEKQQNINKIQEELKTQQNVNSVDFSKLKVHLDLNYIKDICKSIQNQPDQTTLHLMITHYQDFIVLPYIYRKFKGQRQIKIFCTHIAYEMGRIYMKRFFDQVSHFDLLYSEPKGLTYEEESKLQDQFYVKYGVEIKTWVRLFAKQEMEQCLKLANKMNYGEIYDSDGVKLRPFPSGHSLGSSFWIFENTLTKETVMFIRQISNQTWRSIAQNQLIPSQKQTGFKEKDFQNVDMLILANNSLVTSEHEKPENQILKLMKGMLENMEKGINTEVVLEDELIILDIIDYINFEMKDKFRGIFVENPEFNQIVSYANSYVEFLSAQYKNKIYQDPPQYPFQNFLILRQKGFLATGSLFDICDSQKIPLKQLMRRSSPYIHFKSDFEGYLSGLKDDEIKVYKQKDCLSAEGLAQLLSNVNPKKIISFTNILSQVDTKWTQQTAILHYGKQFLIHSQPYHHYISKNISPNIINKYEFVDGFLMAYPVNREFLRFNKTWKEEMYRHLKDNFVPVVEVSQFGLKTKHTHLWIKDYEIFVKGSHLNEVQFILQLISQITKTLRLK